MGGRREMAVRRVVPNVVFCPNGAQGDSPGQSEAPPWVWCARNNPSPERAEPAARKPMCYVSPFQGLGELGRGSAPRSPVYPGWRCALPWAISLCPVGANDPVTLVGLHRLAAGGYGRQVVTRDRWLRAPR